MSYVSSTKANLSGPTQINMEGNEMLKIFWIFLTKITWWNSYSSQVLSNEHFPKLSTFLACRLVCCTTQKWF